MNPILRGKRVILRHLTENDMRVRSRWTADKELGRMMGVPQDELGDRDAETELRMNIEWLRGRTREEMAPYGIEVDGRYIGDVDFDIYPDEGRADLTAFLGDHDYRGKGYGAEATMLVMQEICLDGRIKVIETEAAKGNERSISSLKKLGFVLVRVDEKGTSHFQYNIEAGRASH
jgi:RimJ/RimL family protein N-acetyltransferase